MSANDDFDFLNSPIWLKYTQTDYKTLEETKFRLEKVGTRLKDWETLQARIIRCRKTSAIPIFLNAIEKKFWFYPSDSIQRKAHDIEKRGIALYNKVINESAFSQDFLLDATIEEAITSAIYEGANSTRAKAKELIEAQTAPRSKDEWMLINNYRAMMWIKENQSKEISLDLIKQLHGIVTQNTLSGDDTNFSGRFRNDTVYVHSRQNKIKHEGIKHSKIEAALTEALSLSTRSQRYIAPLVQGILIHYLVAYIHPFFDGNGRTARTLFYFNAIKNNLRFVEILSVSAYLKSHGSQYEKSFEKVVKNEWDMTYFIDFNLDALSKALEVVEAKVAFLLSLKSLKGKLKLMSDNQIGLLQKLALIEFRKYDIEGYASVIGKSREIARQELRQLTDLGLLKETKEGKKFFYQIQKTKLQSLVQEYL